MIKIYLYILVLSSIPLSFLYYSKHYITYEKSTKIRASYHEHVKTGDIHVAIVWPKGGHDFFIKGAQVAAEILNKEEFVTYVTDNGKEIKRKLKLYFLDENDVDDSIVKAKQISKDPTYAAVIGHNGSSRAIPASITYEFNGLPYLSPVATSNLLTQHNFNYVFRNAPRDSDFAEILVKFCHEKKYNSVAVLYCRDTYGIDFSNIFVETAAGLDSNGKVVNEPLTILAQKSYSPDQKIFLNQIAEIAELKPDCIFLAGLLPQAADVIKQIRQMGIRQPIISGDGIDSSELNALLGKFAGEIYVASVFDNQLKHVSGSFYHNASKKFKDTFKEEPDYDASQGFESVYLMAQAFKWCQSTHPLTITSFIKVFDKFEGLSGTVTFSKEGNIQGKPVFIKQLKGNSFERINLTTDEGEK